MNITLLDRYRRLAAILNSSEDAVIAQDIDGSVTEWNRGAHELCGYSAAEVTGKPASLFIPPERSDEFVRLTDQVHRGKSVVRHETVLQKKDGGRVEVCLGVFPIRDEAANIVGTAFIARDISERKRQEMTRRESDGRANQIVRSSPIAMAVAHVSGKNELFNDKFTELFGYTIEDLPNVEHWWPLAYPDEAYREAVRAEWEARRARAIQNRTKVEPMDAMVRCKDGSTRHIEFHFSNLGETSLVSFVDISPRKWAEDALRRSEGYLAEAERLNHSGSWACHLGTGDLFWSQEMFRILGYDPEETKPSLSNFLARVHPEDRQEIEEVLKEESRGSNREVVSDYRIVLPDGTIKHLHAIAHPVTNQRGEVVEVVGTSMDVTDRRRAEKALCESEERFRLVANSAPVMIWMSGPDKRCTYFNQRWVEFAGVSEEELKRAWAEGVHPEDLQRCLSTDRNAFDRRKPFRMEYRLRRQDGEYRWILDSGVPRFNADGVFAGYIGSCIDITEWKLAEAALSTVSQRLIEAHEEERSRLSRELHDDVSQRLALLLAELYGLSQGPPDSAAELRLELAKVSKQVEELASDVQALSHQLHSSKLELIGLAGAAAGFCRELAERQKVEIDFHQANIPRELPKEISLCLFRVLQEALQNAIKHSGSRHFQVLLSGGSSEIELIVRDLGKGFDAEEAIKGRGIGLTSMKERLKLVNGYVSIDSQPQRGTTIHARVPFNAKTRSAKATG